MKQSPSRTLFACTIVGIAVVSAAATYLIDANGYLDGVPRNNPVAVEQGVSQVSAYLAMTDANAFDEPLDLQSANGGVTPLAKVWSLKVDGRVSVIVQDAAYDLCRSLAVARFEEAQVRFVNSGQAVKADACLPDRISRGLPIQANTVVLVLKNSAI